MQFSDRLKYERMQRGWSQARVAELVGTDAGNVSRWERGRSSPSPYFRERLCQLYEKNAQELGLMMVEQTDLEEGRAEASRLDPDALTLLVGEALSHKDADAGQTEAVPAVSSRVLACLSYTLGWLTGLLVLLFNRSNRFVLFHSLQSVCFFGGVHLVVLFCVLTAPLTDHSVFFTFMRDLCGPLAVLLGLIAWGVGMIQAARGRYYQLPLVGTWCHRLALFLLRMHHEYPVIHRVS
jgi:uncharacterized membrane protein/transcriptional regulator with XRE-family HTH domain